MLRHTNARFIFAAALTLAVVFAAPPSARGWNRTGHQVIAYIAYKNLTPSARAKIDVLLQKHFKSYGTPYKTGRLSQEDSLTHFMNASWWPDSIKANSRYREESKGTPPPQSEVLDMQIHRDWHFIDVPFSSDGTPTVEPKEPNLLSEIRRMRREMNDPTTSPNRLAYDVVWLIHLVGDIHQPLHCTTRFTQKHGPPLGDAGGNLFLVSYGSAKLGTSLHTYWDNLFGTSYDPDFIRKEAELILSKYGQTAGASKGEKRLDKKSLEAVQPKSPLELSEEKWLEESVTIAKDFAYTIGPDGKDSRRPVVSTAYNREAENRASKHAVLAGYRLAAILNERFQ